MERGSEAQYERFFRDPIVGDKVITPPMSGIACANIRTALRMLHYDVEYGDHYDVALAKTILRFQTENGHSSRDGLLGPGTRRLLTRKLIEACGTGVFERLTDPASRMDRRAARSNRYIFISYKRDDEDRIAPLLDQIARWGYDIWFDKSIPGGAEWDALIEEKVSNCEMVIAFISQDAVESKWVRREVKFADSLNKPIVAVKLEDADLRHGMKMLLSQYQIIDADDDDFPQSLKEAIDYARRNE